MFLRSENVLVGIGEFAKNNISYIFGAISITYQEVMVKLMKRFIEWLK